MFTSRGGKIGTNRFTFQCHGDHSGVAAGRTAGRYQMKPGLALRAASACLVLTVIAACETGGTSVHGPKLYPVPTSSWRPGDPSLLALAIGILNAGEYRGRWCPWLAGTGSRRVAVVWPAGFHARRHPFELLDSHGTVVATGASTSKLAAASYPGSTGLACLGRTGRSTRWDIRPVGGSART